MCLCRQLRRIPCQYDLRGYRSSPLFFYGRWNSLNPKQSLFGVQEPPSLYCWSRIRAWSGIRNYNLTIFTCNYINFTNIFFINSPLIVIIVTIINFGVSFFFYLAQTRPVLHSSLPVSAPVFFLMLISHFLSFVHKHCWALYWSHIAFKSTNVDWQLRHTFHIFESILSLFFELLGQRLLLLSLLDMQRLLSIVFIATFTTHFIM